MTSGIYVITSPSGGQYIGSAVDFAKRWRAHRHHLLKGNHHNRALQRATEKYGMDALRFDVLLECPISELLAAEQRAFDEHRPRYNACPVAGSQLGRPHAETSNAKNREAHLGLRHTQEAKAKISAALKGDPRLKTNLGKTASHETRAKQSAALTGLRHADSFSATLSDDHRRQLVEAYQNGTGLVSLEKAYRTSHQYIRAVLIAEGVELRPRGGRPGEIPSDETRAKLSRALLGKTHSPERIAKSIEGRQRLNAPPDSPTIEI